jgi:uncharacterized protein (TIGR02452 family)
VESDLPSEINVKVAIRTNHESASAVSNPRRDFMVLGAWGCGVFANDPATVADIFAQFLLPPGPFATAFEHITFAILDRKAIPSPPSPMSSSRARFSERNLHDFSFST